MGLDILEEGEIEPDKLFPCETRPLGLLEGGQHQVITVLPDLGLSHALSLPLEAGAFKLSLPSAWAQGISLLSLFSVPHPLTLPQSRACLCLGWPCDLLSKQDIFERKKMLTGQDTETKGINWDCPG